jgi:hypothetical protein
MMRTNRLANRQVEFVVNYQLRGFAQGEAPAMTQQRASDVLRLPAHECQQQSR